MFRSFRWCVSAASSIGLVLVYGCGATPESDAQVQATSEQGAALHADAPPASDPCDTVRCAAGYRCDSSGGLAECVADVFCGGIAGMACPGAGQCIDDPNDDCDPEAGGADCGGLCDCTGVLLLCVPGTVFDDNPEVCACVEQVNPCAFTSCPTNTECVPQGDEAKCVPLPRHPNHRRGHRHHRPHR